MYILGANMCISGAILGDFMIISGANMYIKVPICTLYAPVEKVPP